MKSWMDLKLPLFLAFIIVRCLPLNWCVIVDVTLLRGDLPFAKTLFMLHDSQKHSAGNRIIFGVYMLLVLL